MEDLTVENFSVKNKFIPSDFNHTRKLFIELAKFHAMSFVLKTKNPKVFENFKKLKCSMFTLMTTESMKHLAPRNVKVVSELFQKGEIQEKLLSYKDSLWQQIESIEIAEQFGVICHGDAWINNVMYNYNDNDAIKEMRIVDWQMTHYGSVGSELTYYLFCCVDKPLRDQHQNELIRIYYESMSNFLSKFSMEIGKVFPFSDLEEQLRKFGLFSFGMATFALPLLCKYPEQLYENENAELTQEEWENLNDYNRRMRSTVLDMIEMKIL